MRKRMDQPGFTPRWLLLCWLLLAQGFAVAHEASHTPFEENEVCAICSVGGNADAIVQTTDPDELSWPQAQLPVATRNSEPSVEVACGHPVRAPPTTL